MIVQSAKTMSEAHVDEVVGSAGANSPGTPGLWTKASGFKEACFGRNARRDHPPAEPLCALGVLCGKKSVLTCAHRRSIRVNLCLPKGYSWLIMVYGSTLVKNSLQIDLFMQNKPNFGKAHNELNSIPEKGLRKLFTPSDNEKRTQNEPKTNPIFRPKTAVLSQ